MEGILFFAVIASWTVLVAIFQFWWMVATIRSLWRIERKLSED